MWSSVIEVEYVHLMAEPGQPVSQLYLPNVVPATGFLIWLRSGLVIHGSYCLDRKVFTATAGAQELPMETIRAWAALPTTPPEA